MPFVKIQWRRIILDCFVIFLRVRIIALPDPSIALQYDVLPAIVECKVTRGAEIGRYQLWCHLELPRARPCQQPPYILVLPRTFQQFFSAWLQPAFVETRHAV